MIHFKYGGSTAGRTIQCPAWIKLTDKLPNRPNGSSPDADRGTLLHDCMEEMLRDPEKSPDSFLGVKYKDQVVTQDDIDEALIPSINAYEDFAEENDIQLELPEQEVKYADEVGGTSDLIAVSKDTVFILDWKFGFNYVSPVENPQGFFYAMCARQDPRTADLFKGRDNVCVVIVQPTSNAILSTFEFTMERLNAFETEYKKALEAQDIDTQNTGEYCKFCPAMATCPAKNGQARQALMLDPASAEGETLVKALNIADEMIEWAQSVKKMAHEQLELGASVSGYKLVDKRASRKWENEKEIEALFKKARSIKIDEVVVKKVVTPTQFEKICKKKGLDYSKYASYITKVSSGTTLAKADDPRPEAFNVANFANAINVTE